MLDNRLQLAYDLYDECALAADIGTDHALLPSALLRSGRCGRMILTDISPDALENARSGIVRRGLTGRAELRLGDGLEPIREQCSMISILGMGGRTIRRILLSGAEHLQGAALLLSSHTDLPLVRDAIRRIGYSLCSETPCLSGGRFYLMIVARPGQEDLTPRELRIGKPLFDSPAACLPAYIARCREIQEEKLRGLERAENPDTALMSTVREDIEAYNRYLKEVQP